MRALRSQGRCPVPGRRRGARRGRPRAGRRGRRVARFLRPPLADFGGGAEVAQAPDDASLGGGGNEDVERPVGRARHDGRGEGGVAAGGDHQTPRPQGFAERQAGDFEDAQIEHDADEVARLVRARNHARLVLDPERPGEAERRSERRLAREPGAADPMPIDRRQRLVEFARDVLPGGVGKARGARQAPGREPAAIAQEGVIRGAKTLIQPFGPPSPRGGRGRRRRRDEHVVDVVAFARRGAGERKDLRDVDLSAAAVTDEDRRRRPHAVHWSRAATPLSALNFSIIASHAGARSRSPSQNDWRARTVKSSSETPCCSTQVK